MGLIRTKRGFLSVPDFTVKNQKIDPAPASVVKSDQVLSKEEKRKMPDSEAKTRWQKENMALIGLKLHRTKDADIIEFLTNEGKEKQKTIKKAIREYMESHAEGGPGNV